MQHLAGVGSTGQDGVVAQRLRVAERGALLVVPLDFADGGVDVDHQPSGAGAGAQRPRSAQHLADDGFELADVTEREGPQERAQRRGCHDPVRQHAGGVPRAQHIGVVDVGATHDHRVHQRQHLAARQRPADAARQPNHRVHDPLQLEPRHDRPDENQPGVGHQIRIVEVHLDAVDRV
jgi:hypothetical protein